MQPWAMIWYVTLFNTFKHILPNPLMTSIHRMSSQREELPDYRLLSASSLLTGTIPGIKITDSNSVRQILWYPESSRLHWDHRYQVSALVMGLLEPLLSRLCSVPGHGYHTPDRYFLSCQWFHCSCSEAWPRQKGCGAAHIFLPFNKDYNGTK